jgi:hypothetical protein
MFTSRGVRVLLLLSVAMGALISSGTASAACLARPLVLMHAAGRTPLKLPAFLRATMICGADRGPRGLKGATGLAGATGARGADGANGSIGQPGPAGTNGTNGINGRDGANGGPGPAATRDYAYLYDVAGQTVAPSGDVLFRTDGAMTGEFVHPAGSSSITFLTGGTFKVTVSIAGSLRNQVGVTLNGVSVVGAIFGTDDNSQQNGGQAIVSVGAGQQMTIRNQSTTAAIPLDNTAGGAAINVDASILIERLA